MRLRGDLISQGQVNGFPIYRLLWRKMASRHRMFEWCNTSVRAKPFPLGSQEYLSLELYVAWRGRGMLIESPAVRR
jgi:L-cysteine S-thiosulfotransferase